jgi:hypothetical protein
MQGRFTPKQRLSHTPADSLTPSLHTPVCSFVYTTIECGIAISNTTPYGILPFGLFSTELVHLLQ